jgi:hypothetical protein
MEYPMPTVDLNTGMEEVEPTGCWNLLATEEIGRVVVVVADRAEFFAVYYAVDEEHLMFRPTRGRSSQGA